MHDRNPLYASNSSKSSAAKPERILVIRLGALGDLVLCFQAFHDIRKAHPDAEIALLTMPAFAAFARAMPWFDEVIIDDRASGLQIGAWWKMLRRIDAFAPTRVYDLQGKFRQTVLYGLLGGPMGPEWSGAAPLCSHPRLWPPKPGMHFTDFVGAQLRLAGVQEAPGLDLNWLDAPLDGFSLPESYAVLIPGCAPNRLYKRWPPENYAILANSLNNRNIASVAVGTAADAEAIAAICALAPHVIDLGGKTALPQLAAIMRRAAAVIGNDTGPTHLAAALGAPTLALFSGAVNPVWSGPRGSQTRCLQRQPLGTLGVDEVLLALAELVPHKT